MGLLNPTPVRPPWKKLRHSIIVVVAVVVTYAAFAVMLPKVLWYPIYYHSEWGTIHRFLNAVLAGDTKDAYQIWKPVPSYTFDRFMEDWGPDGYYGPVKSYNVKDTDHPKGCACVDVSVQVSPYQPFPDKDDFVKQAKTKELKLRVEYKDQSIGFPLED